MARSITYGVPTDRCGLQLRLGIEKGFFREHGIDLTLRVVFGGPEIAAEFDSGSLKIGELGTPPALTAMDKGARFKVIGSGVRRGAVQYFVAHPQMSAWSDLHGAKLGVLSRGSCSDWYMREVLRHYGLDPETDVTIVGLGPRYPEILTLLAQGDSRWSDHFGAACHHRRAGRALQGVARLQQMGSRPPDAVDHRGRKRRGAGA